MVDVLTGLPCRRGWQIALGAEESRCQRHGHDAVVFCVRVDERSDALAAAVLRRTMFPEDVVARPANGEIAILAVECDAERASQVERRIQIELRIVGLHGVIAYAARRRDLGLGHAWAEASTAAASLAQAATAAA